MKIDPPLTLKDIAAILSARYKGDPKHKISGINEIHMVETGDLTFVDHPKYYQKALNSQATTVIINQDMEPPDGKAIIISDDPFGQYVVLVKHFMAFNRSTDNISHSAIIGEGTIIQPGAFVGNHVVIGKNCLIHANVSIYDHSVIGDNVIIHSNSVIGADAYYFQRKNDTLRKLESCGRVFIEDDVEIGALCSIDRGVSGDTTIGKGTKFDNHVQVGHDTRIGSNCLIGAHSAIGGVTRIEDDVVLWARVSVNKDVVIGKGAVILATSGIDKSLPGNKVYFGSPVDEARKKWKELAAIRNLPDLMKKIK